MATKVRIIQRPDGYYEVQKRGLFGCWRYQCVAYTLEHAETIANKVLNPIVKEYE
jgi:hypothetical protein